jgi:hypothetical protein
MSTQRLIDWLIELSGGACIGYGAMKTSRSSFTFRQVVDFIEYALGVTAHVFDAMGEKKQSKPPGGGCLNFRVRGAERLVHGGGRRLRRTTDAVGKLVPHLKRQPS